MPITLTVISDNSAKDGLVTEFGLSLYLDTGKFRLLFDTGGGTALTGNAGKLGIDFNKTDAVILSHGHSDHTGGLAELSPVCPVYTAPGIAANRFSVHADGTRHPLTMPEKSASVLKKSRHREIAAATEILPGIFLTGPIPRNSGEDCGGDFRLADGGTDGIADEQALLTADGILLTGCCHAGIINTVNYCRTVYPEIRIRIIAGGLHLRHADNGRLRRTAEFLDALKPEKLLPLHCTGENAAEYLNRAMPGIVQRPPAGESVSL